MRKTFVLIIVPVFISVYMIFLCSNVVAYNNFSRSIVVATRLVDIELLDVSNVTLAKGYFTSLLTFENPSIQTLNLTRLEVACYPSYDGGSRIALGKIDGPVKLGSDMAQVIVRMNLDVGASFELPSYWIVIYRLKLDPVHYSFTSEMRDSATEIKGPFSTGESEAFTLITTYTLFLVDAWAVVLGVIAVLIIFQERKIEKTIRASPKGQEHNRMLAIMYGLQGIGIVAVLPFLGWINSVISEPPVEFPYGLHGAAGIAASFVIGLVFVISLIFLGTALGLLLRARGARSVALSLSVISVLVWLLGGVYILTRPAMVQDLALAALYLATVAANVIAAYILLKMHA